MAYATPIFNLTAAHIRTFSPYDFTIHTVLSSFPCQLRGYGPHPKISAIATSFPPAIPYGWSVLCPLTTDVRDLNCTGKPLDFLEVPLGSGRWYVVGVVDDVAKGFANQYRVAIVAKGNDLYQGTNVPLWPAPIP